MLFRMAVSRRKFLSGSGLAAASIGAFPHIARPVDATAVRPGQKPSKIIHLVADGMSLATLSMADQLAHLSRKRGLAWLDLHKRRAAQQGLMDMRSLNSLVTDSSAASSSWASGSRIVNGTVNILPDGQELTTLYELFGQAGWKRGLVTTTEITHATPAGFAAKGLKREAAEAIATQYLERGVEVLLGGGRKFFDKTKRKDKRDVYADYRAKGYALLDDTATLAAAPLDKPWLGTFAASHLPFTVDHTHDVTLTKSVPTLAAMTKRALEKLARHERFILQVEGGRVDHGCHMNDAAAAFFDQIAFDEALEVCLEFQRQHADALLVITTDHSTGNPGLNGTGKNYSISPLLFSNLLEVKASFSEILIKLGAAPDPKKPVVPGEAEKKLTPVIEPDKIAAVIKEGTGYDISTSRAKLLVPFLKKEGAPLYTMMNSLTCQLGQLLANYTAVGWTGNAHTSDYVPISSIGPGAERFVGFIQNTDVFRHYTDLAGIDFRNPESPLIGASVPENRGLSSHWMA